MTSKEIVEYIITSNVNRQYIKEIDYQSEKYTVFNLASNNISLSISLDEALGGISYCITDNDGNVRDADTKPFDNDDQLEEIVNIIIGVFNVMKDANIEDLEVNIPEEDTTSANDEGEDILLEEGEVVSLSDGLKSVKESLDSIGDKILELVKATDDPEMKEIITSLSNSAYALALDVQEAQQTYIDLQSEDLESPEDDIE